MSTFTLYDVIKSELIKLGHDEFVDDLGNWVFFDKEHQFIQKILRYDDVIHEVITLTFFHGLRLADETHDKHFKRAWITKFYNRNVNKQTLEDFSSQVIHVFLMNEQTVNHLYENVDNYLTGLQTTENDSKNTSDNTSESFSDSRNANQSQAQNIVDLDVDNHILDYADDFSVNRNQNNSDSLTENVSESTHTQKNYDLEKIELFANLLELVMMKFDRKCFSQIW